MFAGKQKAWGGATVTFVSALALQMLAGGAGPTPEMVTDMVVIGTEVGTSLAAAGVSFLVVWWKGNVTKAGVPMRFVKQSGVVVDAADVPTGAKVSV